MVYVVEFNVEPKNLKEFLKEISSMNQEILSLTQKVESIPSCWIEPIKAGDMVDNISVVRPLSNILTAEQGDSNTKGETIVGTAQVEAHLNKKESTVTSSEESDDSLFE